MSTIQHTTGLILAGGAGLRAGGRDKGLLTWRNKPLAAHAALRLRPHVLRLLISCNRNRDYYDTLADATVTDSRPGFQGPLAGLEAAIPHLAGEFLIVTPCDMPLLPPNLSERLLETLTTGDTGVDISYAHDGDREQYLCAAIRIRVLPSLTAFLDEGHRAVRHWYKQHQCRAVDFSSQAQCFANYNWLD